MSNQRIIGVVLLVLGVVLIYLGFNDLSSSSLNVEVMDVELSASNRNGQVKGIIEIALGVLSAVFGLRYFKK